ncbi:MAG: hypothetical protein JJ939_01555 [Alphaproteobacteria bacterium]|jgi:hypothetical protein|nr:hypothetical protein [Rhodobiaceae bacterium]MBO6542985.1 hypothetical protein [Alphaproteobacteria bacterium]MBO6627088.1 hypothetical protein [Alphaproteobacteria bacterium]MDF1626420.1 hypothetical protein [Parvibaculaceae bacterium]|tara:strand:- start:187 stop:378 length:192 start_codon:yes stop_codon:yes gene_type:complete
MAISPASSSANSAQQAQAQASIQAVALKKSAEAEQRVADTIKEASEPKVPRDPDRGQKVDVSA